MPIAITYLLNQYKTEEICDKVNLENSGTFMVVTIDSRLCLNDSRLWFKIQRICDKATDNYTDGLESFHDCSKTKKCDEVVDTSPYAIQSLPECYK